LPLVKQLRQKELKTQIPINASNKFWWKVFAATSTCCIFLCFVKAQAQSTELQSLKALPNPTEAAPNSAEPPANPATTVRIPLQGSAQYDGPVETPRMALPGRASMAPPKTYRGWLEQTHPGFSLQTSTMDSERLVVISDKYDQAERTLESLGLPYKIMNKKAFDSYDLSNAQVVIIDCGPNNLSWNGGIKIRDFVINGGYLLTTDWMLDRLNQHVFPGFIAWSGATNKQKMYEASIVGKHPALFRHAVTNGAWKMDIHCHLIRIFNKEKVRVLAVSDALAQEDPDGLGALAVVFPFGRGYVMHMMAHFDRGQIKGYELPDASPAIGISLRQALAINYVVAALSGAKL
jgi:hypothetical protein